ncbi:bifunctional dttp/utp pyrophosphatase/methyltransferase protein-related [Holotrichia oblita]|nr:bifunctional dttp/utp pyrophosphatase/methyltransferase protein-related [Holotrichia oblita]
MKKVILASASPRRMEILKQAGIKFEVKISNVSEDIESMVPEHIVMELSKRKAYAVADSISEDAIIIVADTIVACNDKIMGKPKDKDDAIKMIEESITASYIDTFAVKTKVWVHDMTKQQIFKYVSTGEPMDKAGAYAIQGQFATYIKGIEGDYYNVVGLPLSEICQKINRLGYDIT